MTAAASAGSGTTFDLAGISAAITDLQELDFEPDARRDDASDWAAIEIWATSAFVAKDNAPRHRGPSPARRARHGDQQREGGKGPGRCLRESGPTFRTGSASVAIHDSQPRDAAGTPYADSALNQLVLCAEMRAEAAPWRGSILLEAAS
jgi:hypothetical protein